MSVKTEVGDYDIDRIFLYEENPRHEKLGSQDEIITHLCRDEQVLALAESISQDGTNPLELVGLVEKKRSGQRGTKKSYEVWEGNRRICAIQLLNDPEKAPAKQRAQFDKLAQNYSPIRRIKGVVFADHHDLRFWMENIHGGEQGGKGRKRWDTQQRSRFAGTDNRHAVALALLDRAQDYKFITPEQRKKRITTLDRYVSNRQVKDALGLDVKDPSAIKTDLTDQDFKATLKILIDDLLSGEISSRHNANQIGPYARQLPKRAEASTDRVTPRSIKDVGDEPNSVSGDKKQPNKPKRPSAQTKINPSPILEEALVNCGNHKLSKLYYSICDVSAHNHSQLIAIGAWALIETLTAAADRNETTDFTAFYSKAKLQELGFRDRGGIRAANESLGRLSRGGNTTKHHASAATYDAGQLINDMEIVTPILIATVNAIK